MAYAEARESTPPPETAYRVRVHFEPGCQFVEGEEIAAGSRRSRIRHGSPSFAVRVVCPFNVQYVAIIPRAVNMSTPFCMVEREAELSLSVRGRIGA